MSNSGGKVLGVVVLTRHGDRQGFYQDPNSYAASATAITPLGETQEFQLGTLLRQTYLNSSSPSYIQGIADASSLFQANQVVVRADAGGEGGVIFDSAIALLQGLWPVTTQSNTTLANGTTVVSPLGGYQYVPVESVEPDEDVSLEGFTSCPALTNRTTQIYDSPIFKAKASESASFLSQLPQYLDGREVTLENMWNIYDYMNVQSIHNATFARRLPPTFLEQARDLANYHEYSVFSDSQIDGVGNIAGRTMLPSILTAFERIANSSDPLKLHYSSISYKPFLSLFNMTGVVQASGGGVSAGIVDYAASAVFEVIQPTGSTSEPTIRFLFKNGTSDPSFHSYPLAFPGIDETANNGLAPLSTFLNTFQPAAINGTLPWCHVCGQTKDRGCAALLSSSSSSNASAALGSSKGDKISPVGAGFLGAGLTAAVFLAALGVLLFLGVLSFGKRSKRSSQAQVDMKQEHDHDSETNSARKFTHA
ncbi:phosphoglycerate mutase-like protein [Panus rudis PR-1116 ss-1]|nr:phosphoglycerate mutase-like protein [Panus rudis PR-1116 ss-1]